MSPKQWLRRYYAVALEVDHDHFDRAFTVLLLLVIGVLLAETPQYRSDSQLFPLVIGVPTFLLLTFLLGVQLVPRIRTVVERYAASDVFDLNEVVSDVEESAAEGGQIQRTLPEERRSVVSISVWTIALFIVIVLIGFLPGSLVFLLAFYRFHAEQSWVRSVLFSAVMWSAVVLIFEVVLNTPFYTGVFEVELPLPF